MVDWCKISHKREKIIATAGFYVNIDLGLFLDDVRGGYTADVAVLIPHPPPVLVILLFP